MSMGHPGHGMHPAGYVKAAMFVVVFYINYLYLARRCMASRRDTWRFALCNLALLIIFLGANHVLSGMTHPPHRPYPRPVIISLGMVLRETLIYSLIVTLAVAMRLHQQWLNTERHHTEMLTLSRQDELRSLKNQLNPHFLFNTLNTIYALIDISPDKARGAVHELSGLLRYVLYENPSTVTLRQEIAFVDNYLKLVALRLDPKVPLDVRLDTGDSGDYRIAPLLFITVIENIFKHGDTSAPRPIKVSITAHDGRVECFTSNYPAPGATTGTGIGLANLRRRLELIYATDASLNAGIDPSTGLYMARLRVRLPAPDKSYTQYNANGKPEVLCN